MPQKPPGRLSGDVAAGLALLLFTLICYGLTMGFPAVPAMLSQNIPPTFFPRLVLGVMALFSVVLIAGGLRAAPQPRPAVKRAVWLTAVPVALTPLAIATLGTWLTITLVCLALPALWGERRWPRIVLLAIVLPLCIYGLFGLALDLRFPAGLFAGLFS
jgi:hypothetical protein